MGLEKEINNSTIVSMIEQKLPAEIEKEWIKIVTGEKQSELSENKFPALLELLLQFKERIEYHSVSLRARSSVEGDVNAINEGPVNKDPSPNKDERVWCWPHPDSMDYPIWRCKTSAKKSPAEKVSLFENTELAFPAYCRDTPLKFAREISHARKKAVVCLITISCMKFMLQ